MTHISVSWTLSESGLFSGVFTFVLFSFMVCSLRRCLALPMFCTFDDFGFWSLALFLSLLFSRFGLVRADFPVLLPGDLREQLGCDDVMSVERKATFSLRSTGTDVDLDDLQSFLGEAFTLEDRVLMITARTVLPWSNKSLTRLNSIKD